MLKLQTLQKIPRSSYRKLSKWMASQALSLGRIVVPRATGTPAVHVASKCYCCYDAQSHGHCTTAATEGSKWPRVDSDPSNTEVVLDANLEVVTLKGREAVSEDPEGHSLPWYPKPALRTARVCTHSCFSSMLLSSD